MATARGGLSTSDIDGIRASLAAGRKPKVMFTDAAGQIAGEIGQVVKLDDPHGSDEWVVVQFGRDELPFAPTDLAMPPKGRTAKKATATAAANEPAKAAVPSPRTDPQPVAKPPAKPAETAPEPAKPARSSKRATKAARSAKPKAPSTMTVTLAYDAGEWTVAAHQGSKTLAKPYVVRPSEALKMVTMLDVPGVHDAVEAIVSAELAEAARRAETLRSELAEVEARLAELKDAG
jgi:hypothetical protein